MATVTARTNAILDLCGGDVLLPSQPPALKEQDAEDRRIQALRHVAGLPSKLASSGFRSFVQDLKKFGKGAGAVKNAATLGPLKSGTVESDAAYSSSLTALADTLSTLIGLIRCAENRELNSKSWDNDRGLISKVAAAIDTCLEVVHEVPQPHNAEERAAIAAESDKSLCERFWAFLRGVMGRVQAAAEKPGSFLVLPCGWLRYPSFEDDGGHCVLVVLARQKEREFTLAIVNTGEGLQYHPVGASGKPPNPELPLRQSPLVLKHIPVDRLTTSGFWYLLYRQLVYPCRSNGPSLLYSVLLPFANQRPLSANFGTEGANLIQHLPVPVAGDRSFVACVQRAVHYCLVAGGGQAATASWFSTVTLRQVLVTSMNQTLVAPGAQIPSIGLLSLVRIATSSLARAAVEHTDSYGEQSPKVKRKWLEKVKGLVEEAEANLSALELGAQHATSIQPPPCPPEAISGAGSYLGKKFGGFERLRSQNVESLKGEVDPPRILMPVLTCTMPLSVRDPYEAAECCRLTSSLLALLTNQQDQITHSLPVRFALVTHLMTRLLPMPLPINHPEKQTRCFWMQSLKYETKADLMRHLYSITRHFSAVAFTLRANRETDGARVCVAGALAAVMDALMRRPTNFLCARRREGRQAQGSLISEHYCGSAEGPLQPFGLDPGVFREVSETLLLVTPEYMSLRTLVLDYFQSIRDRLDDNHVIFQFDRSMACSEGDRTFMEQVGLCLGVEAPRRDAHLLITGERPEVIEIFLELSWFRDVVFLWKMLLVPTNHGPEQKNFRATDSILQWSWQKQYVVRGFQTRLNPEQRAGGKHKRGSLVAEAWADLKQLVSSDGYQSDHKAMSGASASVLVQRRIRSEDDVLFLPHVPTFNDTLTPAESELLLTYLTAPYIRVPLLLGFFMDRQRIGLLGEPQLQSVLDAALFEPGPWQTAADALAGPPNTVPAPDRTHLSTPVGLLFNELLKSPRVVLEAVLSMLRVAVEKDTGRPGAANERLILYLVRLAVRVESFVLFLIQHAKKDGYLERYGANYEAKVRSLPVAGSKELLARLEADHAKLRHELQTGVFLMLFNWAKQATRKRDELMHSACRAHAHLALLYKNVAPDQFCVRDIAVFLSSQIFLTANHAWFGHGPEQESSEASWLGISEFELFDMFESKKSHIADWLADNKEQANDVLEKVERVATLKGTIESLFPGEVERPRREWTELKREPGNFVPKVEAPASGWFKPGTDEKFEPWLLRTTQGPPENTAKISVNLGQYRMKCGGLELLPTWVANSSDYQDAYGRRDVQCAIKEVTSKRKWRELMGDRHDMQCWVADDRGPQADTLTTPWIGEKGRCYDPECLQEAEMWLAEVFEPVRERVKPLDSLSFYFRRDAVSIPESEIWLVGVWKFTDKDDNVRQQIKEVVVTRVPPLVEVYDVIEHGRQLYRTLSFSSNTLWSFHCPTDGELPLCSETGWCLAAGHADLAIKADRSIVIFRTLTAQLGRQMFVPRRLLRGLLPDALLERYRFWRSEGSESGGLLIGNEREWCDTPTRIHVFFQQEKLDRVTAVVQRSLLKVPENGRHKYHELALWSEDVAHEPEILANLRTGAGSLAKLFVRLENLSHILVWAAPGSGCAQRVELPRLRLSFSCVGDKLYCEQHGGKWLASEIPPGLAPLLAQWGGATVLLEDDAGEFLVLVSAVAEPIRPMVHDTEMDSVERHLPSQLLLRRGAKNWLSNLSEGSRHYYYPVHLTQAFAFAPTPSAGLYLLLCRFLTWHFAEVAAMASAISEITTPEEQQLWGRLEFQNSDHHADAVACRLRLTLATRPYGAAAGAPWDIRKQLLDYARKRHLVSASCALSCEQELFLLELPEVQSWRQQEAPELMNRYATISAVCEANDQVSLTMGLHLDDSGFDRSPPDGFLSDISLVDHVTASMQGTQYRRPPGTTPTLEHIDAFRFLNDLFADGGGPRTLKVHFMLLYELFTGTISLRPMLGDDSGMLASVLLRLTCTGATMTGGSAAAQSVLRVLDVSPGLRKDMPQWGSTEVQRTFQLGFLKIDHDSSSKLVRLAVERMRQAEKSKKRDKSSEKDQFPKLADGPPVVKVSFDSDSNFRYWAPPVTEDVLCKSRGFLASDGAEFASQPLQQIGQTYAQMQVEVEVAEGRDAVVVALEKFRKTGSATTLCARRTLDRLLSDLKHLEESPQQHPTLGEVAQFKKRLNALSGELASLKEDDSENLKSSIQSIVATANDGATGDWLRRKCGHLAEISFTSLVAFLMAREPESSDALQRANPSLSEDAIESIVNDTALALCRTVRLGQASRAQKAIADLQREIKGGGSELALLLKSQAVAEQLLAQRHFTRVRPDPQVSSHSQYSLPHVLYDPRLLVFEFLYNILLRESQVQLIGTFVRHVAEGRSVCHQMIMGAGKTTVVAPLLGLLLADGDRFVCACMPAALLEMSRGVLAGCFSSPVLPKPILTLSFHRLSLVSSSLRDRLDAARFGRAIVVATPTSLKSVLLKQVELLNLLDASRRIKEQQEKSAVAEKNKVVTVRGGLRHFIGRGNRSRRMNVDMMSTTEEDTRAAEVQMCGEILRLFHQGAMLMDEVDLLLDPLKSELNWPMGKKRALDLIEGGEGPLAKMRHGLRYRLPFHLLDGIFSALGAPMTVGFADRKDATDTLASLSEVIDKGKQLQKLQAAPHLLLLSKTFYMEEMLPELVNWALLFLEAPSQGALNNTELRSYLLHPDEQAPRLREQLEAASDMMVKLINLTKEWLHVIMPHILSKVHRVSYGLLLPTAGASEDFEQTLKREPQSRQLLAVPFVGKDQPSDLSEFSHPDVLIGMTIMAYRLSGMRKRDLRFLIKLLREEMRLESTAKYHRRAACKAYVAMVTKAGGKVRGFSEDGRWQGDFKDEDSKKKWPSEEDASSKPPSPKKKFVTSKAKPRVMKKVKILKEFATAGHDAPAVLVTAPSGSLVEQPRSPEGAESGDEGALSDASIQSTPWRRAAPTSPGKGERHLRVRASSAGVPTDGADAKKPKRKLSSSKFATSPDPSTRSVGTRGSILNSEQVDAAKETKGWGFKLLGKKKVGDQSGSAPATSNSSKHLQARSRANNTKVPMSVTKDLSDPTRSIWALEMVDQRDPEQLDVLFQLLGTSPLAIQYYLEQYAFQPGMDTVDCNEYQMTASGQELAGPQLFGLCLGFSGTPNDLLPKSMGRCVYAAGDDGAVLGVLSNTDVVSVEEVSDAWTPLGLLDIVAEARHEDDESKPRYHALIDTGALITGMTNLEVATYLLKNGLQGLQGVVFLNQRGQRMVLVRDGFKVIEFAQCGLSLDQRFTFYDHVHTTGMDIKQPLSCTACLTLSKDMTFRDYAQGAYRMRGIGKGQRIQILLIPELTALIHKSLCRADGLSAESRVSQRGKLHKKDVGAWMQHLIVDVIAWLVLNGIHAEEKKHRMLCQQNLQNLWRQAANSWLECSPTTSFRAWLVSDQTKRALGALRNHIRFTVPRNLPGDPEENIVERMKDDLEANLSPQTGLIPSLFPSDAARNGVRAAGEALISEFSASSAQALADDDTGEAGLELGSEQVQEQEEEQEEEEEQEQEQQVELEIEAAVQRLPPEAPADLRFVRDDEAAQPWPLKSLAPALGTASPPFYPLSEFSVNKGVMNKACKNLPELPEYILLSENHYRRAWRLTSCRRLRNIMCFLEWVPSSKMLSRLEVSMKLTSQQRTRLEEVFKFYDSDDSGKITSHELQLLLQNLDLDEEGQMLAHSYASEEIGIRDIEREITSQTFYRMQQGRFFVVLSLEEAEHLRSSMHLLASTKGSSWPSECGLAVRCLGNAESLLDSSLIDEFGPVISSAELKYQLEAAQQCLRFANSAADFEARDLNILLRSLQLTNIRDRRAWWNDIRACRRRAQTPWEQLPVAQVFVKADEFDDLSTKALLSRTRWALASLRLWPADAFQLFDTMGDGSLSKSEVANGLEWLGLRQQGSRWPSMVDSLFRYLDQDSSGRVDIREFKDALEDADFRWESVPVTERPAEGPRAVEDLLRFGSDPTMGPHFSGTATLTAAETQRRQEGRFRLKWQTHSSWKAVWNTASTLAETPLSIWMPDDCDSGGKGFRGMKSLKGVRLRVPMGFIASDSFGEPNGAQILEVTDTDESAIFAYRKTDELHRFVDHFFPHPVRFRQIWAQLSAKPLYIWEGTPPSDEFVAIGIVASTEDVEPPLDSMRCAPRLWAERVEKPRKIWTASNTGGEAACFWASSPEQVETRARRLSIPVFGSTAAIASAKEVLFRVTVGARADVPPAELLYMPTTRFHAAASDT